MITPGLLRRSLARAAQWRLLLLQLILLAVPAWIAVQPWADFLQRQLGYFPRAASATARLAPRELLDLAMQLSGPEISAPQHAALTGLFFSLVAGALFAGAVLAVAKSDEPLRSRPLLEGAATHFGRMLRMLCAGLIPLAVAGAGILLAGKWSSGVGERALTEEAAVHASHIAALVGALLLFVAILWLDAARALFVAQPQRRSAFFAVFAGGWLLLRRPLRALAIGLLTMALSVLLAGGAMALRQQIVQRSSGRILLALLISEIALALFAWGRAARLIAFVELARADGLARLRMQPSAFEMAPPRTSPPPVTAPATVQAMLASGPFEMSAPDRSPVAALPIVEAQQTFAQQVAALDPGEYDAPAAGTGGAP